MEQSVNTDNTEEMGKKREERERVSRPMWTMEEAILIHLEVMKEAENSKSVRDAIVRALENVKTNRSLSAVYFQYHSGILKGMLDSVNKAVMKSGTYKMRNPKKRFGWFKRMLLWIISK